MTPACAKRLPASCPTLGHGCDLGIRRLQREHYGQARWKEGKEKGSEPRKRENFKCVECRIHWNTSLFSKPTVRTSPTAKPTIREVGEAMKTRVTKVVSFNKYNYNEHLTCLVYKIAPLDEKSCKDMCSSS